MKEKEEKLFLILSFSSKSNLPTGPGCGGDFGGGVPQFLEPFLFLKSSHFIPLRDPLCQKEREGSATSTLLERRATSSASQTQGQRDWWGCLLTGTRKPMCSGVCLMLLHFFFFQDFHLSFPVSLPRTKLGLKGIILCKFPGDADPDLD